MFEIKHIQDKKSASNYIEVKNTNAVYAKIDLNLGGSLQELILNTKTIISSNETLPFEESYASAVLFPFANRIENGRYQFNGKSYQLPINKPEENNAIHGLVYNKTFSLVHSETSKNFAAVYLRYIETGEPLGFPFKYIITLSYTIDSSSIKLIVEVKNSDEFSFPFTVGWHPYFVSSDFENSYLKMNCSKQILVNHQRIPTDEVVNHVENPIKISDLTFDDCFILDTNNLCFKTPDYYLDFFFSTKENYIQLYIPPNRKTIAIEPQTGSANNFNDNRGLKVLHPQELFEVSWKISIDTTEV